MSKEKEFLIHLSELCDEYNAKLFPILGQSDKPIVVRFERQKEILIQQNDDGEFVEWSGG